MNLENEVKDRVILVDKPAGITSFAVVREVRKKLGVKKVGHAGTLDPMATGLLIVGVGKGTKKLQQFLKQDKQYEVTILLGVQTETGDIDGKILKEVVVSTIDEEKVKKSIEEIVGVLELPVPLFSAIKKDGKRLYKHAYRGNPENIIPPMRKMKVYGSTYQGITRTEHKVYVHVLFSVASGVYIRSLVEEFGRRICLPATVDKLRRISVGELSIKDSVSLDNLAIS